MSAQDTPTAAGQAAGGTEALLVRGGGGYYQAEHQQTHAGLGANRHDGEGVRRRDVSTTNITNWMADSTVAEPRPSVRIALPPALELGSAEDAASHCT